MKELIKRHYNAIVKRGLITDETVLIEFIEKLKEEQIEVNKEIISSVVKGEFKANHLSDYLKQELIDVVMVIFNMFIHFNIDIEQELIKNIKTQEKRANEV